MNRRVEDPEWIVPMLFQYAMSKDANARGMTVFAWI
jgi:hypothetical protein